MDYTRCITPIVSYFTLNFYKYKLYKCFVDESAYDRLRLVYDIQGLADAGGTRTPGRRVMLKVNKIKLSISTF